MGIAQELKEVDEFKTYFDFTYMRFDISGIKLTLWKLMFWELTFWELRTPYRYHLRIGDYVWQIYLLSRKFFYFGTLLQFLMFLLTAIVLLCIACHQGYFG